VVTTRVPTIRCAKADRSCLLTRSQVYLHQYLTVMDVVGVIGDYFNPAEEFLRGHGVDCVFVRLGCIVNLLKQALLLWI